MSGKSPDAYRTISEAGEEAGLPTHVLRFWESKFAQLKPVKRAGGRRMYRPQDISLIKGLKRLLYEEGYTIKGAQKFLREQGVTSVAALGDSAGAMAAPVVDDAPDETPGLLFETPRAAPARRDEPETEPDTETAAGAGLTPGARQQAEAALSHVRAARARLNQALETRS
ncbi:MerR family transcriptional regulator [Alkalicaulis satelles]|uniref:MerR family transcriptional regulator n=1 Tax=Alkalicaulis satelles TaxID=2609175 RepID=A0A5M6ZR25_9PROT|nr:MerR family transcriptional regulator [Alkalicaulis satelles]KAA5804731.1 MerR family transcriptional regulator [Alkalicaulis satelles]